MNNNGGHQMDYETEVKTAWEKFSKSNEIQSLHNYPKPMVKEIVFAFAELIGSAGFKTLKSWNEDILLDALTSLLEEAEKDDSPDSTEAMLYFYFIIRAFLNFAAWDGDLSLSSDDLKTLIYEFEEGTGLAGPPIPYIKHEMPEPEMPFEDPNLPQWQEHTYRDIMSYTQAWVDSYVESPAWKKRTKGATEFILSTSLSLLTEAAYGAFRKTPKSWTKKAITSIMANEFVAKLSLDDDEFKLIVPAISGLLDYVSDNGWLNKTRSENFKRYLAAGEPEMLKLAKNPENYGPAKLVGRELIKNGIDLSDKKAVDDFIQEINANGGIDSLLGDANPFDDDEFDDDFDAGPINFLNDEEDENQGLEGVINDPQKLGAVAELYDVDKEKHYLDEPRIDENGSLRWSQSVAENTHNLGVQYGLSLWLQRDKYHFSDKFDAPDVTRTISEVVDVLYAQTLETPDIWSVSNIEHFGAWVRKNQSPEDAQLISNMLKMIGDNGTYTTKKANDLIAAFKGKVVSLDRVRKSKGKLRKKKKRKK
jgi:hypothetical protein